MSEISLNIVRDAVMAALTHHFPDTKMYGEEIKQGFQEPCFFVKLLQVNHTKEMDHRYRRGHRFDIHYFDTSNRSLHNMAEQLYDKLEYLKVDKDLFRGTGMEHEIINGVLHFFVDLNMHAKRPKPNTPKMQVIEQEGRIK